MEATPELSSKIKFIPDHKQEVIRGINIFLPLISQRTDNVNSVNVAGGKKRLPCQKVFQTRTAFGQRASNKLSPAQITAEQVRKFSGYELGKSTT